MTTPPASAPAPRGVFTEELTAIAAGVHQDPHRVLGAHLDDGVVTFRTLRPLADAVVVVTPDGEIPPRTSTTASGWPRSRRPRSRTTACG